MVGIKVRSQQGIRHAFGSNWLALHKAIDKFSIQSGHGSTSAMWGITIEGFWSRKILGQSLHPQPQAIFSRSPRSRTGWKNSVGLSKPGCAIANPMSYLRSSNFRLAVWRPCLCANYLFHGADRQCLLWSQAPQPHVTLATVVEKALAYVSGTPAPLRISTNLRVSNITVALDFQNYLWHQTVRRSPRLTVFWSQNVFCVTGQ